MPGTVSEDRTLPNSTRMNRPANVSSSSGKVDFEGRNYEYTVDGRNPAPVENDALSYYLKGFNPKVMKGFLPFTVSENIMFPVPGGRD